MGRSKKSDKSVSVSQTPQGRIHAQQEAIMKKTGLSRDQQNALFPNVSVNFFMSLKELVNAHFERRGWNALYEALKEEARFRKQGVYGSCSQREDWMPIDPKHAQQRLDRMGAGVARSGSPMYPAAHVPGQNPGVHVVFCGIGDPSSLSLDGENAVRSIQVTHTDPFLGPLLRGLDAAFFEELERNVGVGLCYNGGRRAVQKAEEEGNPPLEGPDAAVVNVHGIILTLRAAELTGYMSVDFFGSDWLRNHLANSTLAQYLSEFNKPVILFSHMRRPHRSERNCNEECGSDCDGNCYDKSHEQCQFVRLDKQIGLAKMCSKNRHDIRRYPSPKEDAADMGRLHDIKTLDEIAKDAPPEFSFRPRVCYASSAGCDMAGYDGRIIVRGSSDTGPGETMVGSSNDPSLTHRLKCCAPSYVNREGNTYFHQELIPTLETWGEISVIMVGDSISRVAIIQGPWVDQGSYRTELTAERCFTYWADFNPSAENATAEDAMAKLIQLHEFARYQRGKLVCLDEYETLNVAVRLDIGISEISKNAKFFVTEVVRWPGADMLSPWLFGSAPYDAVVKAIGEKFAVKYGKVEEGGGQEEEDEEANDSSELSDPPDDSEDFEMVDE